MHFGVFSPEKYYENDPKMKREDVQVFHEWLKKQPHLPELCECQLTHFLHSCYYSIEAAKATIQAYLTRRTLYPELFHYPGEDVVRKTSSVVANVVLPKKTLQGCTIFWACLIDFKPENFNFVHVVILISLIGTLYIHQNGCLGDGVIVLDFKGATLTHLTRVNLAALKRSFDHLQEGVPLRIKGIHIINAVPFMDKVIALAKPFIHSKLLDLLQIHFSLDTFYKYIPKECLPADYGGDLPTIQMLNEETVKTIFHNLDFYEWHDGQTVDESKRMETSKLADAYFGVEGTFKKLEID